MSESTGPSASGGRRRTGWAELSSGETVELAGAGARLGARVLDVVILFAAYFVVGLLFIGGAVVSGDGAGITSVFGTTVLILMIGFGYEVVQTAVWGQTLGKRVTGVRVINASHGGLPGWGKAVGRWGVPSIISLIPAVGPILGILCYASLLWDRVSQGWHDKAAGTLVVKA